MILFRRWAVAGVVAAGMAALAGGALAEPAATAMTCTNPASGTSWQIRIDYVKRTVDSNPASISNAEISWHDPKDGGNYTLDRASGQLKEVVASSTGGYFLFHRCAVKSSD